MGEKFSIYNKEGQVKDIGIAKEMAKTEMPSHEKILGIFPPSEKKIAKGEMMAEEVGAEYEKLYQELRDIDFELSDSLDVIARGIVNGHNLEFTFGPGIASGTLDGQRINSDDAKKIAEKYGKVFELERKKLKIEKEKVKKEKEGEEYKDTKKAIEDILR